MRRAAQGLCLLGGLLGACSATPSAPTSRVVQAPGAAATLYGGSSQATGAVRGLHVARVQAGLAQAREAGQPALQGDQRLGQLATWVLAELQQGHDLPPTRALDFAAHHLGLFEPAPTLLLLQLSGSEAIASEVAAAIRELRARYPCTHYGAAAATRAGRLEVVLVLSARWARLEPVPRQVGQGQPLRLRGELAQGFERPRAVVTLPDGSFFRSPTGTGQRFSFDLPTRQAGSHRVELLARGARGVTVVGNFPVYVGVQPAQQVRVARYPDDQLSNAAMTKELLTRLNAERAAQGLATLELSPKLNAVALAHSADMHEQRFVGHTSPRTGEASDRVEAAGIETTLVMENIGRGYSPAEIHRGLMDSPGHRANILSGEATHVGIGSVVDDAGRRPAYLVTQVFIRRIPKLDPAAAERLLERINARREQAGAQTLRPHPRLAELASAAARSYFAEPGLGQDQLASRVAQQLRGGSAPGLAQVTTLVAVVGSLEQAEQLSGLDEQGVTHVGLGLAQGTRQDAVPNAIAVVVLLGRAR